MQRVLTVGLRYSGPDIPGTIIETAGLGRPSILQDRAAFALYEYDTIIINPASYSHFLFGEETEFSHEQWELGALKNSNEQYDLDTLYRGAERSAELDAAIAHGANVFWCMAEQKRQNFFGYRSTKIGYANDRLYGLIKMRSVERLRGRTVEILDRTSPLTPYFEYLAQNEYQFVMPEPIDGIEPFAVTPTAACIGGAVLSEEGEKLGWLVTPPPDEEGANLLVQSAVRANRNPPRERFHGIFLSHTHADKPLVRAIRQELMKRGVENVWIDEAELQIGDSLHRKIAEGIERSKYFGIALSPRSVEAPWVQRELEAALNNELQTGEVVVLPLLMEECELPLFLRDRYYANFTDGANFEEAIDKILHRLRRR